MNDAYNATTTFDRPVDHVTGRYLNGESAYRQRSRWLGSRNAAALDGMAPDVLDTARPVYAGPTEGVEADARRALVDHYLPQVEPRYRKVLELVFYGRRSERQLAAELGIARSPAKRLIERSLEAMARAIALSHPEFVEWENARRSTWRERGGRGRPRRDRAVELEVCRRVARRFLTRYVEDHAVEDLAALMAEAPGA